MGFSSTLQVPWCCGVAWHWAAGADSVQELGGAKLCSGWPWGRPCLVTEVTSSQCTSLPQWEGLGAVLSRGRAAQSPPKAQPGSWTAGLGAQLAHSWAVAAAWALFIIAVFSLIGVSWNNPCRVFLWSGECSVKLEICLSHRKNFLDSNLNGSVTFLPPSNVPE